MKNIIALLLLLITGLLTAQQLDKIGKKDAIKFSGGLSAGGSVYTSNGIDDRYDPYNYMLAANASASIYGWSFPFSILYSNKELSYGQPFNIIGISPSYKTLKIHLGYRSMSFSPYTMSGRNFYGAGVEWTHTESGISLAGMYGRLVRAVQYDSIRPEAAPVYARWGYAFKVAYAFGNTNLQYVNFYAKDDDSSLNELPPNIMPTPEQNFVHNISAKQKVNEIISVYGELAVSAWTKNTEDSLQEGGGSLYHKAFFIPVRQSTYYYNAYKCGMNFTLPIAVLGFAFERVEPEFHSLGAYNIANDFQNITINAKTSFLEKKLTVAGNIGLQKDDLNNENVSKMNRVVGSASFSYVPNKRLSLSTNYSGFNAITRIKPIEEEYVSNTIYDQLDTMDMVQLTNSVSCNGSYVLKEADNVVHRLNANGNYQVASSEQGSQRYGNSLAGGIAGYSMQFKKTGFNFSASINSNVNMYDAGNSLYAGCGVQSSMPFIDKKLRVNLALNSSQNLENGNLIASLYSLNNTYSLKLWDKHNVSAGVRMSGRRKYEESDLTSYNKTFMELMANVKYSWSF